MSLTFKIPFQKCESLCFFLIEIRGFPLMYFSLKIFCHKPSEFSIFQIHLDNKHLFIEFRSKTPNPPWSFGMHTVSQCTRWYFLLLWPPCHNIRFLNPSTRLITDIIWRMSDPFYTNRHVPFLQLQFCVLHAVLFTALTVVGWTKFARHQAIRGKGGMEKWKIGENASKLISHRSTD